MGRIDQYMAVGLSPTVWGAEERADIEKNLDHLHDNLKAAIWLSGLELPVELAVIPEEALQGFTDEVFDMDRSTTARRSRSTSPGPRQLRVPRRAEPRDVLPHAG